MRFPSLSDLDREQRKIYTGAPNDGAILVVGPPGTGKTVMAFHRAEKLKKLSQAPRIIMYNRVLRDYTESREGVAEGVPVSTMHQWVAHWWRAGRMGQVPKVSGKRFEYNWEEICDRVLSLSLQDQRLGLLNWGHLIIDEGQDFPAEMYFCLGQVMRHLNLHGNNVRLTVFADDNQRLQIHTNCTVESIAANLGIRASKDRLFFLSKNYRNTKQIAAYARYFQVGHSSGVAELPDRIGEKPVVVFTKDSDVLADFIVKKAKINPGKQIGVIVQGSSGRVRTLFDLLKPRAKQKGLSVQYYLSKDRDEHGALNFAAEDSITVLHQNSAKGLEFDLVFYVGLESVDTNTTGGLNERMAMYVMSSRARDELYMCIVGADFDQKPPDGLLLLPYPKLKLCGYQAHTDHHEKLKNYLNSAQWSNIDNDAPFWQGDG